MSLTQPQGSSAPATLDMTYKRNDGAPGVALLGSEPHLQPDTAELAEIASAARTAETSATEPGREEWRGTRLV
jgi:hypothetical protein